MSFHYKILLLVFISCRLLGYGQTISKGASDRHLTGYWKFDEAGGKIASDSSGKENSGVLGGTALFGAGKIGAAALSLDGKGLVSISNQSNQVLPGSGAPFSISLWFKAEVLPAGAAMHALLSNDAWTKSGFRFGLWKNPRGNQKLIFHSKDSGGSLWLESVEEIHPKKWYRVLIAYDGQRGSLHLNGTQESAANGTLVGNAYPIIVGGGIGGHQNLNGVIDDLKIFNRSIQGEETGLTGYWPLEEATGRVAEDATGHGNAGTLLGSGRRPRGRIGPGGFNLEGEGQLSIQNGSNQVLPPPGMPFSISFWFKPSAIPAKSELPHLLLSNDTQAQNGFRMGIVHQSGSPRLRVWSTESGGSLSIETTTPLAIHQWHLATFTFTGNWGTLFLNGSEESSRRGIIKPNSRAIILGANLKGQKKFSGTIDDLRIYSRALSQWEIGLSGEWRFDEGRGRTAMDSTFSATQGTLSHPGMWGPGRICGGAVEFAGNHSLSIPNTGNQVLPATGHPFSISFWFKPHRLPTMSQWGFPLLSNERYEKDGFRVAIRNVDGKHKLAAWSSQSGGSLSLLSKSELVLNQWYHAVISFTGTEGRLYLNDVHQDTQPGSIKGNSQPLLLGSGIGGLTNFFGLLDEVKVYQRTLHEAEIVNSKASHLPRIEDQLVTVSRNGSQVISLSGDSPPGKTLKFSLMSQPSHGTLIPRAEGAYTYTPKPLYKGPDSFRYQAANSHGATSSVVYLSVVEDLWLSPRGGGRKDGSSPSNAFVAGNKEAYDTLLIEKNFYHRFHYAPGVYETRGWQFLTVKTAQEGCKHIGAGREGREKTTLKLVDANHVTTNGVIFGNDWDALSDGFEVHAMELDCNSANNPKLLGPKAKGIVAAISVQGNNLLFKNLKIIRFGTRGGECFPLASTYISPPSHKMYRGRLNFSNIIADDCIFTQPASNNTDGLTCGLILGDKVFKFHNAVFKNCQVLQVASDFTYTHGFVGPEVKNSFFTGCQVGVYFEPAKTGEYENVDYVIRSNTFQNVILPVHVLFLGGGVKSITMENNRVFLPKISGNASAFVSFIEPPATAAQKVETMIVRKNVVTYYDCHLSSINPLWEHGFYFYHVKNLFVEDNIISLGTGNELMINPAFTQILSLKNNRDAGGTLVRVKDSAANLSPVQQNP